MKHQPTALEAKVRTALPEIAARYALLPPTKQNVRAAICEVALLFKGVSEEGDSNSGFFVDLFLIDIHLNPGLSWCLAFVQWVIKTVCGFWKRSDILPNNTGGTQALWRWANDLGITSKDWTKLQPGDIIILRNGTTAFGHVTFALLLVLPSNITDISGNTSSDESKPGRWRDGGSIDDHTWPAEKYGRWGVPKATGRWVRGYIPIDELVARFWTAD